LKLTISTGQLQTRGGGFETIKELEANPDVKKLKKAAKGGAYTYLTIFRDHDVWDDEDTQASRPRIKEALEGLWNKRQVKSILVSRDDQKPTKIGVGCQ
ncbi:MAG: hypothetical protein N3E40_08280, partial [Dehalococcoidia bacterium]|nr:hypothetical protein [Dehalococcoidia bacterium]